MALVILLGLAAVPISGALFRSYPRFFLFLWLFIPVIAFWMRVERARFGLSVHTLKIVQGVILISVCWLSFVFFAEFPHIRAYVGRHFVDGDFGLWLFEWLFIVACAVIPFATWRVTSSTVAAAEDEDRRRPAES